MSPAARLLPALLLLAACAAPWRGAAIAISTVDRAGLAAEREWTAYDKAHEDELVNAGVAANRPAAEVKAEVLAWRATADRVTAAFDALRHACEIAKDAVLMAAAGKVSISGVADAMLAGVRVFLDVLTAAKVKLPAALAPLQSLVGGGA